MHVLLIEDDIDHEELILRTLQGNGRAKSVHCVRDGAEVWAFLRHRGFYADKPRPDIILLDLKLRKVNGHEVLAQIKSDPQLNDIPVIVLTTSDAETDRQEAYRLHANSYLVKPANYERFRRMIEDLGNYWSVWNQPPWN